MRGIDRRTRIAAALCCAALGVFTAACGSSPQPKPLPTHSVKSTPTPTPTPTPTTPAPPTIAATPGESEQRRLVRQEIALEDYAWQTGDTGPLEMVVSKSCKDCYDVIHSVHDVYDKGGHAEGDLATHIRFIEGDSGRIQVVVQYGEVKWEVPGQPTKTFKPEQNTLVYRLAREGNRWVITKVTASEG